MTEILSLTNTNLHLNLLRKKVELVCRQKLGHLFIEPKYQDKHAIQQSMFKDWKKTNTLHRKQYLDGGTLFL